jgi:hypothetical protein
MDVFVVLQKTAAEDGRRNEFAVIVAHKQGDQIGRIFAFWAIVCFMQVFLLQK